MKEEELEAVKNLRSIRRSGSYADSVLEVYATLPKGTFYDDLSEVVATLKAQQARIEELEAEIEGLLAANDRLWLERNEAVTKVQGWERVVFHRGFQPSEKEPTMTKQEMKAEIERVVKEKLRVLDKAMRRRAMKGTGDER